MEHSLLIRVDKVRGYIKENNSIYVIQTIVTCWSMLQCSQPVINSFLHLILNDSYDRFNHNSSILPLMLASLLANAFRPTLREFDFKISKYTCSEVKIWFWFRYSSQLSELTPSCGLVWSFFFFFFFFYLGPP